MFLGTLAKCRWERFSKGAKAKSTVHCYERAFGKFVFWSASRRVQSLPASEIISSIIPTFQSARRQIIQYRLIKYFFSISWKHNFEGFRDPNKSSLCKEILEAAKRHCSRAPSQKKRHLSVPQVVTVVCNNTEIGVHEIFYTLFILHTKTDRRHVTA